MERAKCRSCGAEIIWLRSAASRQLLPLDAEPVAGGNIALIDGLAHVPRGELWEAMLPDGPRYVNHFSTCPQAAEWRRKKGGKS